ncbi:hypothetical protein ACFE04_007315 [Oxalis oulophora]
MKKEYQYTNEKKLLQVKNINSTKVLKPNVYIIETTSFKTLVQHLTGNLQNPEIQFHIDQNNNELLKLSDYEEEEEEEETILMPWLTTLAKNDEYFHFSDEELMRAYNSLGEENQDSIISTQNLSIYQHLESKLCMNNKIF